ncbi:outer membrane protein assembly factor BamB [Sphaerotilus uruguayifluvii]|uniref:Outer membrane protein assembly factor BamB n=1 Tax=Sphaerotilus uruguayifluvii TaxID=2735897 RepID=A0ABX2G4D8_9BURK|nr:outer membrane protein assembly factor BamB [Leptothrix sp. C29]NRT57139.1 outer membrane assembly lipoprotein YfgL [Leptothrix sp. C29]
MIKRRVLALGLTALATLLAACGSTSRPKPAPLEPLQAKIAGRQVWRQSVGEPVAGLSVAVLGDRFLLASARGQLVSLDIGTGEVRSRVDIGAPLSAGVGSDGRHAAVVTQDNELVVADSARVVWRTRLNSRVVTAPLVAGERVFVQAIDRSLWAFDAFDGRLLWSTPRSGEALSLAQPGVLQPWRNTLLAGVGPRLVAIEPLGGAVQGQMTVAAPRGTNEVERLGDLVGPAARQGETVCVRSFQAGVGCVNAERGSVLWTRQQGGFQGLAMDGEFVFGSDASDRITAWRRSSGDVVWNSDRLRYRSLSAPIALGSTVVFGDAEGWLHVLSRDRGEPLLRLPTDGSAIAVPLVRSGLTVLAVTRSGNAFAFRPE